METTRLRLDDMLNAMLGTAEESEMTEEVMHLRDGQHRHRRGSLDQTGPGQLGCHR